MNNKQNNFTTLSEIESFYVSRNKKSIYYDKQFTSDGIDYMNYIPMRFDSINDNHIRDYYTINGWYLLWYLMSNSDNKYFIKTNINVIIEELKLSSNIIKKTLNHLQKIGIIKIYTNEKNNKIKSINSILYISIAYYLNSTYKEFINKLNNSKRILNGYRAIPKEYVNNILLTLSPNQWSILSVLFIYYTWCTPSNTIDIVSGKILKYDIKYSYYAFPRILDICSKIGLSKPTIIKELYTDTEKHKALIHNQYKIISKIRKEEYKQYTDKNTYENRITKENNRYYLSLFERYEYLYYYLYNIKDNRDKEIINKIKKNGYEKISHTKEQCILNNKDYIEYVYGKYMKEYSEWTKNNNDETKELYLKKCKDELIINT